ncbi:MAG TPA: RHS repeat-associated core domain-containing protein [Polyangiaceae bacterium]
MTTRFATVVSGPGRETIVSYYNASGDNIRIANFDRLSVDTFEYDAEHNQTGHLKHTFDSLDAVEPRVCSSYDNRGLVRTVTRSATDYSNHQTTCVSHDEAGPWITRVTEAGNASRVAFSAAYSGAGNPELVLDANSLATRFDYDADDRLESRTDSNGSITTFGEYDPDLQFPRFVYEDAEGAPRFTELGYSDWGQLSAIRRFSWGTTQIWNYDERTRLRRYSVTGDEGSFESVFSYLDNGLVDYITDPEGVTSFEYDRARDQRILRRTSGDSEQISCLFSRPDGLLGISVDPQGARRRTDFVYAQQGDAHSATLTTFVDSDAVEGCATRAPGTYSDVDGVLSVVRQDHALRPVYVSDGAGNFEARTYDEWGRLATRVFGEGETRRSVRRYYDSRDRLIAEVETAGASNDPPSTLPTASELDQVDGFARAAFFSHDRAGRPKSHSVYAGADGRAPSKVGATAFTYQDAARRVIIEQETPGGSREVIAEYDGLLRPTNITTNFGYSASITYPTFLESVVETRTPDGQPLVTETNYNRSEFPTLVKVNGVEIESLGYDTLSRVTSAVQSDVETAISYAPFGGTQTLVKRRAGSSAVLENIEFTYDDRGRLMNVFTGNNEVVEYRYDVLGRIREERRTSAANPSSTVNWERTFVGTSQQVDRLELPSGRAVEYDYADGRPVIDAIVATAANVANLEGAEIIRFDYDHDGLSTEATVREDGSPASSLTAQVDGIGRRIGEETSLSGRTHSVERDWSVGVGMTGLTVNGRHFTYERLSDGRLDRVRTGNDVLVDNTFEGDGEPVSVTYGNGLTETRSFDNLGRTLTQDLPGYSLSYGYGTDQTLRRVTTQVSGTDDRSSLFETDAVGRIGVEHLGVPLASTLTSGTITNDAIQAYESQAEASRVFSYDAANNWTNVTSSIDPSWSPAPNAANAYTQTPTGPADYDADGRLISDGEREYGYDAFGRLARVTGPGTECTYQYDAEGRRSEATCNGATVQFGYDGADLVAIYDQAGAKIALREVALAAPFALLSENDTTYLLVGASRSVYAAFDDTGELVENYEYSAFGETTTNQVGSEPSGNPFRFHGHLELALTGMVDMRARAYSPKLGRFLAPDPLGPRRSPNLYNFVGNTPHVRWDPFGLSAAPATSGENLLGEFLVTGIADGEPDYDERLLSDFQLQDPTYAQVGWLYASANQAGQFSSIVARDLAAAGYMDAATIAEWGWGCTYCHVTHDLNRVPTDQEIDLARLVQVAHWMASASDTVSTMALLGPLQGLAATPEVSVAVGGGSGPWVPSSVRAGGAVAQSLPGSCGAACVEMLSGGTITEAQALASSVPEWSNYLNVARALEAPWQGGLFAAPADALAAAGRGPMAGLLWSPGARAGHLVVLEPEASGLFLVRDPLPGVTYSVGASWVQRWVAGGVWK